MKEYYIGIDYGTSTSCVGIYMNGAVQIAPNKLGERITPSIVCFTEQNKVLVGEETINQKMDQFNKIIYEVKRFIGLSYEEFVEMKYNQNLNYEVVNQNGFPKIKININGKESFYSPEEISSLIIKKMVKCAEDFIEEVDKGVKIDKAIITVPAHFNEQQRESVKWAARQAGIEITRIINEPTAAALAYGIGKKLIPENKASNKYKRIGTLTNSVFPTDDADVAPLAIESKKSSEDAIVFDLGGGTFDITLLNISKNIQGQINFEILGTDGDIHLGGSDFDTKLIDYCINEFCEQTGNTVENVRQNKKSCKRLKIKCENAKKLLSISKETIINIENFIDNKDLFVRITRDHFDDLCKDLYDRIEKIIKNILDDLGKVYSEIDDIILVGGASRMPGIKNLLSRLFGESKIRDSLNPDEAVAYGATLESAKIEEKNRIDFNLQDIIAYKLGVASANPDPNDTNGELMYAILRRFTKIPNSNQKKFKVNITKEFPNIQLKIYEGNDKYVKNNKLLRTINIDNLNTLGVIEYDVKFDIDANGQLTVNIIIDSLKKNHEEIIKSNITHGFLDLEKKKVKICKSQQMSTLNEVVELIKISKKNLSLACGINIKLNNLNDCCLNYEKLVEYYMEFINDNESVCEKVYLYTKELFTYYIERLKLKNNGEKNIKNIIQKIKQYMSNLISTLGYIEDLLDMFTEIQNYSSLKNEYYEIFVNYMELLNKEGLQKKGDQKFSRYYSKLYFESAFYSIKKYIKENDLLNIDKSIRDRFEKAKKINQEELKKVNNFTEFIEKKVKEGKFLFGKTGFTIIAQKINKFERDMNSLTIEEVQEILDIFKNMADSFDKKENSIGEAYCISNIIIINNMFFQKGYEQLWSYINRLKTILFTRQDENYDWINTVKEIIKLIESGNKND